MLSPEEEEQEFVNEDKQIDELDKLTDDEDVEAAEEVILEELDKIENEEGEPSVKKEETSAEVKSESEKTSVKDKGTSDEDDPQFDDKEKEEKVETSKEFSITDEFINKQPEDTREILAKYKGKGKADLIKASAHAIAMKNPYTKDDANVIAAIESKLQAGTEEDIVKTLIETQKETGKKEEPAPAKAEVKEIQLPDLEDTPEVKAVLQSETLKMLKKKYPDMPEDPKSQEYKDWARDQQDDDPEFGYNFAKNKEQAYNSVHKDLRTTIYVKEHWRDINNNVLEKEVDIIKKELKALGIDEATAKDKLGLDLTLTKDENGSYFNPHLNELVMNGTDLDQALVREIQLDKDNVIPLLRTVKTADGKTLFAKKFMYNNILKINNFLLNNIKAVDKEEVEKLHKENLNTVGGDKTSGLPKTFKTAEEIAKITDEKTIDAMEEEVLNSL